MHLSRNCPFRHKTNLHLELTGESLEDREKNPLEKLPEKRSSGDGAPKLQISVPCDLVEGVLSVYNTSAQTDPLGSRSFSEQFVGVPQEGHSDLEQIRVN